MLRSLVVTIALALVACGGAQAPAAHAEHDHHHGVAEVDALHEEIAPVFHAEAGEVRVHAACEHASALRDRSIAVQAVGTPDGVDGDHWHTATAQLVGSAEGLATECSTSGSAVEERLSALHDAFHAVMELAGGEDEHHDH